MTKRKDDKDTQAKTRDEKPAAKAGPAPAGGGGGEALPDEAGLKNEGSTEAKPGAQAVTDIPEITPEQHEVARLQDRLLRLQADFDNYRKRMLRERDEIQKRAAEAVLADLLPALDQLDYGLQQTEDRPEWQAYAEGLRLIRTVFQDTLRKHGLVEVDALGREFDPREHEAVAHTPSPTAPDGMVVAQTRKGYRLGDYLLRAAMVVVSSGPAPGTDLPGGEGAPEKEG